MSDLRKLADEWWHATLYTDHTDAVQLGLSYLEQARREGAEEAERDDLVVNAEAHSAEIDRRMVAEARVKELEAFVKQKEQARALAAGALSREMDRANTAEAKLAEAYDTAQQAQERMRLELVRMDMLARERGEVLAAERAARERTREALKTLVTKVRGERGFGCWHMSLYDVQRAEAALRDEETTT